MKSILRIFLFHVIALITISLLLGNSFTIGAGIQNLLMAAVILTLLNVLLKPIIKILFLPINALTLGLFSLVINAGVFYLFLRLVPAIRISAWTFPGFTFEGITLPKTQLGYFGTIFVASFISSLITNLLSFLVQ